MNNTQSASPYRNNYNSPYRSPSNSQYGNPSNSSSGDTSNSGGMPDIYNASQQLLADQANWLWEMAMGAPGKVESLSWLQPEQQELYKQLMAAGMGKGAGGAFGEAADYYRGLMSGDSADVQAFMAPAMRQYNEQIVPGLSEQFAGMGAGGLSSSGFRNAQIQGATDLTERLAAMRAGLRQQGAAGLQNIGQMGLNRYSDLMQTRAPAQGFLPAVGEGVGKALPALLLG